MNKNEKEVRRKMDEVTGGFLSKVACPLAAIIGLTYIGSILANQGEFNIVYVIVAGIAGAGGIVLDPGSVLKFVGLKK